MSRLVERLAALAPERKIDWPDSWSNEGLNEFLVALVVRLSELTIIGHRRDRDWNNVKARMTMRLPNGGMAVEGEHVKLANLPSSVTEWSTLPTSEHPGESGSAIVRARQFGEIQLRMVEYSASYVGDHWCHKGHLTFVVTGQMVIEHEDGRTLILPAGTSWHVADNDGPPHRARSERGATVFVVD